MSEQFSGSFLSQIHQFKAILGYTSSNTPSKIEGNIFLTCYQSLYNLQAIYMHSKHKAGGLSTSYQAFK
jgi:hypothetical protein